MPKINKSKNLDNQSTVFEEQLIHINKNLSHKLSNLQCDLLFNKNNKSIIKNYLKNRLTYSISDEINIDCDAIRKRWKFETEPVSKNENQYPLAFARTVYQVKFYICVVYLQYFKIKKIIIL